MSRDLPRKYDHGQRIHESVCDARDRIGSAGARSHERDAGLARGLRVTCGGEKRALFVAHQVMTDAERRFTLGEFVVYVQYSAAGIAEDVFDVFAPQRFKQYPRPTHFHKFTSNNWRRLLTRAAQYQNPNDF
jgi:hypothetical protein